METEKNHFVRLLTSWLPSYRFILCSVFCVKADDEYKIIKGIVAPHREKPSTDDSFLIETEHLFAAKQWSVLDDSLRQQFSTDIQFKPSQVEVCGQLLTLAGCEGGIYDTYFSPIVGPSVPSPLRFPSLLITGRESQWNKPVSEDILDLELLTHPVTPFRRTPDLLNSLGLPLDVVRTHARPSLEWFLPPPALIKPTEIHPNEETCIEIEEIGALDPKKFRLGLNIFRRDRPIERKVISEADITWKKTSSGQKGLGPVYKLIDA